VSAQPIPRYDRPFETASPIEVNPVLILADLDKALADSALSPGTRDLIRAILRLASPAMFPGGGVGLEYGPLLKTVTRPDVLARHIAETAAHLRDQDVHLLVIPGMSGYPIGAMYSLASGIPALLLKKQSWDPASVEEMPPGSFIIPSYTGNNDTVISADIAGARDILAGIVEQQLHDQADSNVVQISVRIAGADEIIDKATMATAITENTPIFVCSVVRQILDDFGGQIGDRPVNVSCEVVAWVTPLMKGYGGSESALARRFGIQPFAGATVTAIQINPPAIGFAGLGLVLLGDSG
jgi:hypothetical protein